MHSLNFIHFDIKPDNIAYSEVKNKQVFLDYGLSNFIEEKPGYKTKTGFRGTLSYCSEEMKKCFQISSPKPVCLYQNDKICL